MDLDQNKKACWKLTYYFYAFVGWTASTLFPDRCQEALSFGTDGWAVQRQGFLHICHGFLMQKLNRWQDWWTERYDGSKKVILIWTLIFLILRSNLSYFISAGKTLGRELDLKKLANFHSMQESTHLNSFRFKTYIFQFRFYNKTPRSFYRVKDWLKTRMVFRACRIGR